MVEGSPDKATLDREFSDFYREHLRDIYNYTYYRTGNHHDAEDLTTQTFIQAYRHFERAQREANGRPLRPWLVRIAHNLAANYYRDRSRKPTSALEDAEVIRAPHDTERVVEGREEAAHLLCVRTYVPAWLFWLQRSTPGYLSCTRRQTSCITMDRSPTKLAKCQT